MSGGLVLVGKQVGGARHMHQTDEEVREDVPTEEQDGQAQEIALHVLVAEAQEI